MPERRERVVALALVLLAAAAAYAPGLFHAFVYDDHGTIAENGFLEQPANLLRVVTLQTLADPHVIDGQRPTLLLTAFLDRAVWGLNPFGWHLTSLLLHLAATAAFFLLLMQLRVGAVAIPALLFALHPALSEAVQMPSYREDLLAGLFALLYLGACARGRTGGALVWFALALLSKESAAAAPAMAAVLWWLLPATRPPRRAWVLHLSACALLIVGYAALGFLDRPVQAAGVSWNGYSLPWPDNALSAPAILLFYVRLLFLPWPLCADRCVPVIPFAPALCGVAVLMFLAWRMRTRRPVVALGLFWIVLAFVPVSNLLPLFNPVGERYLYLLAPGLLLALAGCVGGARRLVTVGGLVAAVIFCALIQVRLRDWRSDESLWTSVLRVNPSSARAHTWLGLAAKHRDERAEAARFFQRAEELNPHDISALVNLAVLAGESGDAAAAEAGLREALRRRPDRADAWKNLAIALRLQGREDEAAAAETEAARLSPRW